MLATYVDPKKTPLTFERAAVAFSEALTEKLGAPPALEVLALALAKTALETGRWQSIYCFNFGNVKAGPTYVGLFTCIELNEVINGKVVWFAPQGRVSHKGGPVVGESSVVPPGHPQTRMRAYASAEEGAKAYVEFVSGGRYAAAWGRLLIGDAAGYVHLLKVAGYFTADENAYRAGVERLQREFIGKLRPSAPVAPAMPIPATLKRGAKGPAVELLQQALNKHGAFPTVKVDGDFGERTYAAVRIFQQRNKLTADGIVGERTWNALLASDPAPAA